MAMSTPTSSAAERVEVSSLSHEVQPRACGYGVVTSVPSAGFIGLVWAIVRPRSLLTRSCCGGAGLRPAWTGQRPVPTHSNVPEALPRRLAYAYDDNSDSDRPAILENPADDDRSACTPQPIGTRWRPRSAPAAGPCSNQLRGVVAGVGIDSVVFGRALLSFRVSGYLARSARTRRWSSFRMPASRMALALAYPKFGRSNVRAVFDCHRRRSGSCAPFQGPPAAQLERFSQSERSLRFRGGSVFSDWSAVFRTLRSECRPYSAFIRS